MIAFDDQWPHEQFKGDYVAFLNSMTKTERIAWRVKTDKERNTNMAARGRGRPAKPTQAQQLIEALAFVEVGTGEIEDWYKYVRLYNNFAVTFNGQISAGFPIVEELTLCPQLDKLKAALNKCGKSLAITETPGGQLSVKGEKLRAIVNCCGTALPPAEPDAPIAIVDDKIKDAFKVVGSLAKESGERLVEASILLEAYQATGTNGGAVLQYYHGIDLPPHMVLPKAYCDAVAKYPKPLTGFGFSWGMDNNVKTVTFHFDGGAWLKTQCYHDRWPDVSPVLNCQSFPIETPQGLFEAFEAVSHFSEDGWATLADGAVMSHDDNSIGAQYEVLGIQGGKKFKPELVKLIAAHAKTIDLTTYGDRAFFFGGEQGTNGPVPGAIRGAIIGYETTYRQRDPQYQPDAPGAFNQVQEVAGDYDHEPSEAEDDQSQGWGQG